MKDEDEKKKKIKQTPKHRVTICSERIISRCRAMRPLQKILKF